MTLEEFKEKYQHTTVTFQTYWKYTFTFRGVAEDGVVISCGVGGNADDIYRFEVCNNDTSIVGDPRENWTSVFAYKDGEEIFRWYDY